MGFSQSAKEEIKRAADVVELIGQFVQLRKAGRNYVGLCPFHAEKAPSFTVNPERGSFHCFGCKKGGDIFAFWMEYHGITFPEALKDLADRYQVPITENRFSAQEKKQSQLRERLFKVNAAAASYFQQALRETTIGRPATAYLKSRSLSDEIISEFFVGYAPDAWEGLTAFLRRQDVAMETAVQAGLVVPRKSGGYYDRFRGRIIFPILNLRKQVIGFGGRVLDEALPKYINTPETPVFHKGESLYGLHAAYRTIRERDRVIVVEGYTDCLALRNHGLKEVVATLGTALTDIHVRRLKGYAREAIVVFDSDKAGQAAALRSLPIFLNEGFAAKAVVLPEGHDPDSFVNGFGVTAFQELLENAPSMFDFFLENKTVVEDSDVEGKVRALSEILPILSSLGSEAQRALYVRRISDKMDIREEAVLSELERWRRNQKRGAPRIESQTSAAVTKGDGGEIRDSQILHLLVHCPQTVSRLMECQCEVLLSDAVVKEIVSKIFENYRAGGHFSAVDLQDRMESDVAREKLREIVHRPFIVYTEQDAAQAVKELEKLVKKVKISQSFKEAGGDLETLNELLKLKRLTDL